MPSSANRSRHLVPLVAAHVIGFLCGMIGVRWSSAIIAPEILGTYSLLLAAQLVAVSVTHAGYIKHVQRHWTAAVSARAYFSNLARTSLPVTFLLSAGLAIVLAGLGLPGGIALNTGWWGWMIAINLLAVAAHLAQTALQAEQRYWASFGLSLVSSTSRSLLPLALAAGFGATLPTLAAGFLLHSVIWAVAGFWFLRDAWSRGSLTTVAKFDPPQRLLATFMAVGLCSWLATVSTRWFAATVLSPADTGYFMLALNLTTPITTALSLVGISYSFPTLFAAGRRGAPHEELSRPTHRMVILSLVVGQVSLMALSASGSMIIGVIVHPRYAASLHWLMASGGSALALVSTAYYANMLLARGSESASGWFTISSVALRTTIMATLALAAPPEWFRLGLTILPWPMAAFEYWWVERWLRRNPPAAISLPDAQ